MMPINLTRTNLLVYSCFWLFFSSTNMLSFLCLVTISVSQCLLTGGHLCFFLTMKFVPSQLGFLGVGWASLLGWGTARALPLRLQGQGCCWIRSPPVKTVLQPCGWTAFMVWDRLLKLLLPSPWRGCVSRAGSALPGVPCSELRAFLWSSLVQVKPLNSRWWVWPSACTHQGWADNCTQRKMENRV